MLETTSRAASRRAAVRGIIRTLFMMAGVTTVVAVAGLCAMIVIRAAIG
jgi:hypothetical protein